MKHLPILSLSLVIVAGAAFAKGHDQGVADGTRPDLGTGEIVQDVIEGPGISATVNDGKRGQAASEAGEGNRVTPIRGK